MPPPSIIPCINVSVLKAAITILKFETKSGRFELVEDDIFDENQSDDINQVSFYLICAQSDD
jgi:hypothetical protein